MFLTLSPMGVVFAFLRSWMTAESFIGRLRDELLNETLFSTMNQARAALATWKEDYNVNRPHSGLGNITPNDFAARARLVLEAATAHPFNPGA